MISGPVLDQFFLVAPAVLAAGFYVLWSLNAARKTSVRVNASVAFLALIAVPVTRIEGHSQLEVLVPAVAAGAAGLVALQSGALRVVTMPALLLLALLALEAYTTSARPDENEWAYYALTSATLVTGLVLGAAMDEADWRAFCFVIVATATAQAAYAVYELLTDPAPLWVGARPDPYGGTTRLSNDLLEGFSRAQGSFGHPLPLAALLLTALAIVLWRSYRDGFSGRRLLLVTLLLAGGAAAGSRSATLVAVVLVLVATRKLVIFVVLAAAAAVMLLWADLQAQYDRLIGSGSITHRLGAIDALERLGDRPDGRAWIGDGAASAPRLFHQQYFQNDGLEAVDNQVVLTVAQNGWLGLALLALVLVIAARRARGLVRVLLLVLVAQFAIFDLLGWPSVALLLWIVIGVAVVGRSPSEITQSRVLLAQLEDGHIGLHERDPSLVEKM